MKTRVSIIETKFHIDKENEIVVCELKCDMQLNKHPTWRYFDRWMWSRNFPKVTYDGIFSVKATARCNAIDSFDIEKGKRIAEGRAKAKMFGISSRVYNLCSNALMKLADECSKSSMACERVMLAEHSHVLELTE